MFFILLLFVVNVHDVCSGLIGRLQVLLLSLEAWPYKATGTAAGSFLGWHCAATGR
jgi:hypothetical protein